MNKQKIYLVCGVILFIVAGLLLVYAVWSFVYCAGIISEAKASGQLAASGNGYDIVSFYMANCSQYFIFALLMTAAGLILQKNKPEVPAVTKPDIVMTASDSDKEIDEWFEDDNI